ncbi:MAG: hypothetical protein H3C34_24505 [Caldilineaceae bacterium]|nr:hypothetical protein [Caldilineaceae bacterium]
MVQNWKSGPAHPVLWHINAAQGASDGLADLLVCIGRTLEQWDRIFAYQQARERRRPFGEAQCTEDMESGNDGM